MAEIPLSGPCSSLWKAGIKTGRWFRVKSVFNLTRFQGSDESVFLRHVIIEIQQSVLRHTNANMFGASTRFFSDGSVSLCEKKEKYLCSLPAPRGVNLCPIKKFCVLSDLCGEINLRLTTIIM